MGRRDAIVTETSPGTRWKNRLSLQLCGINRVDLCDVNATYRRIPIFSKTHPFKIPYNPPQSAKKHTLQNRDHFRLIPGGPFQVKPDAIDSESSCIDYCTQTDQIANSRPIQTFTPQMIPRLMTPDWLGRDDGQTRVLGNPNGLNFLEVRTFHCTESETVERCWKMVIYVLSSFEIWIGCKKARHI
ncbi:uncharacterized protein TNCV_2539371 [Trichonephila clavipes]|nr:uncharacterized protein TNCV_2539371 [Trichonephila clavipes]